MTSEVSGLNRISVGQLLYEPKDSSNDHPFEYDTKMHLWRDKFDLYDSRPQKSEYTIKRPLENDDFLLSDRKVKIQKTSDDNLSFDKGVEALTLLRNVAFDGLDGSRSRSGSISDELSEEFSDHESKSISHEDDFNPYSSKEKKNKSRKLRVGHHHSKRRNRTTPEQLERLESIYSNEKMPSQELRESLAKELKMTTRRVQIWFQNKRAKERRNKLNDSNDFLENPYNDYSNYSKE